MRLIFSVLVCLLSHRLAAQSGDPVAQLKSNLQNPNAVDLAKWFDDDVEVGINGEKASYPRAQAEIVVGDFFRRHPGRGFTMLHQGADSNRMKFLVGRYQSTDGPVKVYVLLSNINGRFQIAMLDFSKE